MFIKLILLSNRRMNGPHLPVKAELHLEGFTQDHWAGRLELRSLTPKPALFAQESNWASETFSYRTKSYRMVPAGPSKKEEIILNVKAECVWWNTVNWFGRMEGRTVLSLEKWNEQVEAGVEDQESSLQIDLTREERCPWGMLGSEWVERKEPLEGWPWALVEPLRGR